MCCIQLDALEQGASEVLCLIRSWRNRLAPVNQIPPEILALIPDFWNKYRDSIRQDVIALTHVCRAWREVFVARSSLWTNLDCRHKDQARIYLERSNSLPVEFSLYAADVPFPYHPLFEIIPRAIGQLGSLSIEAKHGDLQDIIAHLSHPAPLLEELSIRGKFSDVAPHYPVLAPTLFNGDLSSLRKLCLDFVRTKLPWRSMVNLTSFRPVYASPGEVSVSRLLDFFESAPFLRDIGLRDAGHHGVGLPFTIQTPGVQGGRLVSLGCLERMEIADDRSTPLLLDSMLIPVGAHLIIEVDLPSPPIMSHPPRFLDNLRNFPDFTTISLSCDWRLHTQFSGPNGQVKMIPRASRVDRTCLVLQSLGQFDTSNIERLAIYYGNPPSSDPPYRALLPMKHLRTLSLNKCENPHIFVHALHPSASSSRGIVCPKLETLVIVLNGTTLDMKMVIGVAAARASGGAKLKSVRIPGRNKLVRADVLELKKHVFHVECGPEFGGANDDIDKEV